MPYRVGVVSSYLPGPGLSWYGLRSEERPSGRENQAPGLQQHLLAQTNLAVISLTVGDFPKFQRQRFSGEARLHPRRRYVRESGLATRE